MSISPNANSLGDLASLIALRTYSIDLVSLDIVLKI